LNDLKLRPLEIVRASICGLALLAPDVTVALAWAA